MSDHKITIHVDREIDDFKLVSDDQLHTCKIIVTHVTDLTEHNRAPLESEAPWLVAALKRADDHLIRRGFSSGYRAIATANSRAHRVTAHIRPYWHGFAAGSATVALRWHDKGTPGRHWFFHLAFLVGPGCREGLDAVRFFNSLGPDRDHLKPHHFILASRVRAV